MLGGIGTFELIVILVILLMVFGAGKLPEVMKMLGSGVRSFKSSLSGEEEPQAREPERLEDTRARDEVLSEVERKAEGTPRV